MIIEEDANEINNDDEIMENEEEDKPSLDSWKDLKFMPNKKRFIILSILFSIFELTGLLLFAYAAVTEDFPTGLYDFGLFILPPSFGLILSYFVDNKKEAVAISSINGSSSIIISLIVYIITSSTIEFPGPLNVDFFFFGVPTIMLMIQILLAFTLARLRRLYYQYGDRDSYRESDEAMIRELHESRIKRGLEQETNELEETEEPNNEEITNAE